MWNSKIVYGDRNQISGGLDQGVQGNNQGGAQGNLNMMATFYILNGVKVTWLFTFVSISPELPAGCCGYSIWVWHMSGNCTLKMGALVVCIFHLIRSFFLKEIEKSLTKFTPLSWFSAYISKQCFWIFFMNSSLGLPLKHRDYLMFHPPCFCLSYNPS